jgi:hypothetical protein
VKNASRAFVEEKHAVIGPEYLGVFFSRVLFFAVAIVLILFAGLRPVGLDKDSDNYEVIVESPLYDLSDKEPAFWIIVKVNELLFSGQLQGLFLIFALLGVTVKLYAVRKTSLVPWFSLLLYISFYYSLHELTQIRVGVASGLLLLGIYDFAKGSLYSYFAKFVVAVCFHYSAFVMLVILLLRREYVNRPFFIALPLVGLVLCQFFPLNRILEIFIPYLPSFVSTKLGIYLHLMSLGQYSDINIFNLYYNFLLAFYLVLVILSRRLNSSVDVVMLKLLGVMLFCFYFFSPVPVLAFRISEFFGVVIIILLANVSVLVKQRWMYFSLVGVFAFLYLRHVSLGLLDLTVLE